MSANHIQIKHRHTGAVLFECEAPEGLDSDLHMHHALVRAAASGANLSWADLSEADLSWADLSGANLSWADLSEANLSWADLSGANLSGANLRGADFGDGVTAERGLIQINGLRWDVSIFDDHMQIGCERHSLDDWRQFDDFQIFEMDGPAALRFWRQHKATLLALAARREGAA